MQGAGRQPPSLPEGRDRRDVRQQTPPAIRTATSATGQAGGQGPTTQGLREQNQIQQSARPDALRQRQAQPETPRTQGMAGPREDINSGRRAVAPPERQPQAQPREVPRTEGMAPRPPQGGAGPAPGAAGPRPGPGAAGLPPPRGRGVSSAAGAGASRSKAAYGDWGGRSLLRAPAPSKSLVASAGRRRTSDASAGPPLRRSCPAQNGRRPQRYSHLSAGQ